MGLPAFLRPPTESGDLVGTLAPEVELACSKLWEQARVAWAARPPRGTQGEDSALRSTYDLFLEFMHASAGRPPAVLRAYMNEGLRRVVREQRATAEDDRAFALRQLEQALEHYGMALETLALEGGVDDIFAEAVALAEEHDGPMPNELRPLYRAHGALLMAFETMDSTQADELRFWAREAVEKWRGVVAALPTLINLLRGARAHVRARLAWDSWTEDDRAVEKEAWKTLPR